MKLGARMLIWIVKASEAHRSAQVARKRKVAAVLIAGWCVNFYWSFEETVMVI